MPRAVYFDCFSGASGDMLLGALIDAGVGIDVLRAGLATLPVHGWSLDAEPIQSRGLRGTRARVSLHETDQPHRGLTDVARILQAGKLPAAVVERACQAFELLAAAEASIHGVTVDAVEFHEV